MLYRSKALAPLPAFLLALVPMAASADQPRPWQIGFQEAVTPTMERIRDFHDLLFWIIVLIVALVLGLLIYIAIRFNAKDNPTPSKTTHNSVLEVLWTAVPVLILVVIAVPSFKLLYFADRAEKADMTLKAISHQWFWSYEYPDHGGFRFDSVLVPDGELKPGEPRLLSVDNRVVLPVDTTVRIVMTSEDVIHNWAVPAFGIKLDTVPGRINETWMRVTREGVFRGQCSELCGVNHGFMPIVVEVVSKDTFARWVEEAKTKFASSGPGAAPGVRVADAHPR